MTVLVISVLALVVALLALAGAMVGLFMAWQLDREVSAFLRQEAEKEGKPWPGG